MMSTDECPKCGKGPTGKVPSLINMLRSKPPTEDELIQEGIGRLGAILYSELHSASRAVEAAVLLEGDVAHLAEAWGIAMRALRDIAKEGHATAEEARRQIAHLIPHKESTDD